MPPSANLTTLKDVLIISSFTTVGISTSLFKFVYFSSMYFSVVGNMFCIKNTAFLPNTFPFYENMGSMFIDPTFYYN